MPHSTSECEILLVEPSGGSVPSHALVPTEHCFMLKVEGEQPYCITCSPSEIAELVYGRLLTEGLVESIDDVSSLAVSEDGCCVDVRLDRDARVPQQDAPLVEADGIFVCDSVGSIGPKRRLGAEVDAASGQWSFEQVFGLARAFAADTPIHLATSGSHSCTLVASDGSRFCSEDIGRHNAMDKAIGMAMLEGADLSRALVFTSGRIPADMVSKVARAGIPVLVSKGVPTDLGVKIAKEAGLVLVCAARPDSLKVFNDPRL